MISAPQSPCGSLETHQEKIKKQACIDKQTKELIMYLHQPRGPAKESKEGIIALPLT